MLQTSSRPMATFPRSQTRAGSQQPRKLLLALVLLLAALIFVLVKDHDFWFGSPQPTILSDVAEPEAAPQTAVNSPLAAPAVKKQAPAARISSEPKPAETPGVAVNRTVLPPLDIEIGAGDTRHTAYPANTTQVETTKPAPANSAPISDASTRSPKPYAAATNAAERESITATALRPSRRSLGAAYPVLAQHMNVQGSVLLQAIIGADGMIENLRVLSGPAILAVAAQQAVREWRFKPVLQNGQPVETKAKITVNFTIRVSDGAPKTTLAETRSDRIEVVSR